MAVVAAREIRAESKLLNVGGRRAAENWRKRSRSSGEDEFNSQTFLNVLLMISRAGFSSLVSFALGILWFDVVQPYVVSMLCCVQLNLTTASSHLPESMLCIILAKFRTSVTGNLH